MRTMFTDFMGVVPFDTKAFEDAFKDSASFNEKFARVVVAAAGKNTDVYTKWTKDTSMKITGLAQVNFDPAEYAKFMTDFASSQAEVAAENITVFAEVAKKAQIDSVEIMMAA